MTTKDRAVAASHGVGPDGWMVIFNELMARIAGHFGCVEPRRTATAYVRGLLADLDRKNCWNLAEHAGLLGPQPLQWLLRTARWDADAVRDDLRDFVVDRLGPDGVLIADETGFVKKGTGSTGESTNAEAMLHRSLNVNERRRIAYEAATGEIIVFAQTGGATWHGYVVTWHGSSSTT